MPRRVLTLALPALLVMALPMAAARAQAPGLGFSPCSDDAHQGCATLTVPLSRSAAVPGTLTLSLRRVLAGPAPSTDAVVGLAGGPGQAALPLIGDFAREMAPALTSRDLLVFDQRGTGRSDPLTCPGPVHALSSGLEAARCAKHLGPARGSFTTSDSVDDLESIRQAVGYDKLVLFGVSYGTKVALEYAERYPQHVESLVLDSTVGVTGPDPFLLSTFAAIPRVLGELCATSACARITPSPDADLRRLVARLARASLRGQVFDGSGRRRTIALGRSDLLNLLVSGDENPALRAELPAAMHSALHHDPSPLLRLALLAAGLTPDALHRPGPGAQLPHQDLGGDFDAALYLTTTCEEQPFPWDRRASRNGRLAQAIAKDRTLPASAVAPFDRSSALLGGPIPTCLDWPVASPPPPADAPLPAVPALFLSGSADLRTPTEDAASISARIPGAQLVVVPHVGHSVLGTDLSGCSHAAVVAFFAGSPAAPCPPQANLFAPTPVPPAALSNLGPAPGTGGRPGRTLAAVQATLVDLRREIIGATISANQTLPVGARFGGLRSGSAVLAKGAVRLRAFSYVPGVTVTGSIPTELLTRLRGPSSRLRIGGRDAAGGTVLVAAGDLFSGTLGGRRLHAHFAAASGSQHSWPATPPPLPGLARVP